VNVTGPEYPVTTFPYKSRAVTVTVAPTPAVAVAGAVTVNEDTVASGLTTILLVPLTVPDATVRVSVSALVRVTVPDPTPSVTVIEFGDATCLSLVLSIAVPLYSVATFPYLSYAVSPTLKPVPAVVVLGAVTTNMDAATGLTVIPPLVPVTELSVAVRVSVSADLSEVVTLPTPSVSVMDVCDGVWPSLQVSGTEPLELVSMLPKESSAVSVTLNAAPAVTVAGALTRTVASVAGETVRLDARVATSLGLVASIASTVNLYEPAMVVWPLSIPELEIERPVGNVPEARENRYCPEPPVAVKAAV
jgi:hypothetical protein